MNFIKILKFLSIFIIPVFIICMLCFITACRSEAEVGEFKLTSETSEQEIVKEVNQQTEEPVKETEDKQLGKETADKVDELAESEESAETEEEVTETIMKIESPAFKNNEMIPSKYTCDGEDINPSLRISGIPEEAASLVLVVDDPDAPGKTWVHWTVWNIDPKTSEISENSVPAGAVQGVTDFGVPGYGGPCPPSGTHRYFFKLYALDIVLNLNSSSKVGDIEKAMNGHILDNAELIGLYSRK